MSGTCLCPLKATSIRDNDGILFVAWVFPGGYWLLVRSTLGGFDPVWAAPGFHWYVPVCFVIPLCLGGGVLSMVVEGSDGSYWVFKRMIRVHQEIFVCVSHKPERQAKLNQKVFLMAGRLIPCGSVSVPRV